VLACLVPLLLFVEVHRIGRLFAAEVLLLALLPALMFAHATRMRPWALPAIPIALLLLWLDGQVMTDAYRGTAFPDLARGWLKIAFTLTNFIALYLLFDGRKRRYLLFGIGLVGGLTLEYVVSPSAYAEADPWKFGLATPVTLLLALVATTRRAQAVPLLPPSLFAAGAAVNLVNGYRSLAGICFLSAGYLLWRARRLRSAPLRRPSAARRTGLLLAVLLAGVAFVSFYTYAARSGQLGVAARAKYTKQSGSPVSVLEKGRPEILVGLRAGLDSPVLGHGSWARDVRYLNLLRANGYRPSAADLENEPIPAHSHLVGAWVEAGLLGVPFWMWALGLTAAAVAELHRSRDELVPLAIFVAFSLGWDIFFSPYGAEARVYTPYFLLLLLFVRRRSRLEEPA
jgi:hypothetical protein